MVVNFGKGINNKGRSTEPVTAEVLPAGEIIPSQINYISRSRAVNVGQADEGRIEGIRMVKHR